MPNRMLQMLGCYMLTVLTASTLGCTYFSKTASVQTALSTEGTPGRAGRVAVPVFIQEKYKSGNSKQWGDASLTDRFVTGLLKQGYLTVDRALVHKILKDNGFSSSDMYREDNLSKMGALLSADVVVLGKMTVVEQPDGWIQSRVVTVRGIRAADGVVLFSLSAVDNTMYRVLSGEDLIDQALSSLFGLGNESGTKGKSEGGTPVKLPATTTASVAFSADTSPVKPDGVTDAGALYSDGALAETDGALAETRSGSPADETAADPASDDPASAAVLEASSSQ